MTSRYPLQLKEETYVIVRYSAAPSGWSLAKVATVDLAHCTCVLLDLIAPDIATLQRRRKINWNQADASIDQSGDTRIGRRNIVTEKPAWEAESAGHADVVDGSRGREWDVP